jgi:hypothetical protein
MAIPSKDSHRVGLLARRATAHERMSRVRRRRLYGRATDQIRPLAVERRQPLGAHCDDPERRRSSQAISGRHAALGRRSALAAGRGRGGGIRLGRRPCRNAMSPPMIGRLPFSLQTAARWLRSGGSLWTSVTFARLLGRAKSHDHQAASGPGRLLARAIRLCAFAQ